MAEDKAALIAQIDERSTKLMDEFYAHLRECQSMPSLDGVDKRTVFESWAIQKIAGLQVIIETLNSDLRELSRHVR